MSDSKPLSDTQDVVTAKDQHEPLSEPESGYLKDGRSECAVHGREGYCDDCRWTS